MTLVANIVDPAHAAVAFNLTADSFHINNYINPFDGSSSFKLFLVEDSASTIAQISHAVPDPVGCDSCSAGYLSSFGNKMGEVGLTPIYLVHIDDHYSMQAEPMLHLAINYNASIIALYSDDGYGRVAFHYLQTLSSVRSVSVVGRLVPLSYQTDISSFSALLQDIVTSTPSSSHSPVLLLVFLNGTWADSFAAAAVASKLSTFSSSFALPIVLSEQLFGAYASEQSAVFYNVSHDATAVRNVNAMQGVVGMESPPTLANDRTLMNAIGAISVEVESVRVYYDAIRQIAEAVRAMVTTGFAPEEITPNSVMNTLIYNPPMFGASGPWIWGHNADYMQRSVTDYVFSQLNMSNTNLMQKFAQWTRESGITFIVNDPHNTLNVTASNFPSQNVPLQTLYYPGFWEWASVPHVGSVPSARFGACQQLSDDSENLILLFGANSLAGGALSEAHVFSFATRSWSPAPILGSVAPRASFLGMCTQFQNKVYTFGGFGKDGIVGELWRYDFKTKRWAQLPVSTIGGPADLTIDRARSPSVQLNHKWYIWGGYHGTMNSDVFLVLDLNRVSLGFEILSPEYKLTSPVFQMNYQPTHGYTDKRTLRALLNGIFDAIAVSIPGSTFNIIHDFIAIIGGSFTPPAQASPTADLTRYHNLFLYDVNASDWTPVYTDPEPDGLTVSSTTSGILLGTLIYVYCPQCSNYPLWTLDITDRCNHKPCAWNYVSTTMVNKPNQYTIPLLVGSKLLFGFGGNSNYDTNSSNYLELLSQTAVSPALPIVIHKNVVIPPARADHSSGIIGNRMVIFGGYDSMLRPLNDIWALNLDDGTWSALPVKNVPPPSRFGHGGCGFSYSYFIFYGTDGTNFMNDIWSYSMITQVWTLRVPSNGALGTPVPVGRAYFVGRLFNSELILYGGQSANRNVFADVWRFNVLFDQWTLVFNATPGSSMMAKYPDPLGGPYNITYDTNNPYSSPPPLTHAAGDVVVLPNGTSLLFICGGRDASFNDVDGSWWLPLDNYNPSSVDPLLIQFQYLGPMQKKIHGHSVVAKDDALYVIGGQSAPEAVSHVSMFSTSRLSWFNLVPNPSSMLFISRDGGSVETYGNRLWVFGGAKVDVLNVIAPTFVTAETAQMVLGPALPLNLVQPAPKVGPQYLCDSPCVLTNPMFVTDANGTVSGSTCGPGTVLSSMQCVSCVAGTYSANNSCVPCPTGRYGVSAGASSNAFCVLCDSGKFSSTPGSAACSTCPSGAYCPVGSSRAVQPLPVSPRLDTDSVQANGIPDNSNLVERATSIALYVLFAIMGAFALAYIAAHLIPYQKKTEKEGKVHVEWTMQVDRLIEYDWWYSGDHDTDDDKPVFTRSTPLGGCCTLLSMPVALYFFFSLSYGYALNNYTETRALIPLVSLETPNVTVNVQITVSASGYPGPCSPQGVNVSAPSFIGNSFVETSATQPPVTSPATKSPSYPPSNRVCTVIWHCYSCSVNVSLSDTATVDVYFQEQNIYANAITWRIDANSAFPDFDPYNTHKSDPFSTPQQNSSLWGVMISPDPELFRGVVPAASVQIRVTPTHHVVHYVSSSFTGWTQNFVSQQPGSVLFPQEFDTADGLHVHFDVVNEIIAYEIVVTRNQAVDVFFANILGAVSGAFGTLALLMLWLERYVEDNLWPRVSSTQQKLTASARLEQLNEKFESEIREIVRKSPPQEDANANANGKSADLAHEMEILTIHEEDRGSSAKHASSSNRSNK